MDIEQIKTLTLGPDEYLVINLKGPLSVEMYERFLERLAARGIPRERCLVVDGNEVRLGKLRFVGPSEAG